MNEQGALGAEFDAHLPRGFQKRLGFDIAHGAADFHEGDLGRTGAFDDAALDFVGDMGNHLDRRAEVVAAPFALQHFLVYPAGGEIVLLQHGSAAETFVMAEIEVGFGAVVGDEHFAVLEGVHGARIHIDVGIELEHGNIDSPGFENGRERRGGYTLAKRGDHATGDENVTGHWGPPEFPEPAGAPVPSDGTTAYQKVRAGSI